MLEKLDIIDQDVLVYDENFKLIKNLNLNDLQGLDLTYLNNCKLFTFNLSKPIKRVVKFLEISEENLEVQFQEFLYDEMTEQQKLDFDNFVQLVENNIA